MMFFNTVTSLAQTLSPEEAEKLEQFRKYVLGNCYGTLGTLVDNGKMNEGIYYLIVLLFVVAAYLMGSLNFAVIISRLKFGEDIRTKGSGNAGATNMSRTYGKAAGIFTLLGDIMKTVIPVLLAKILVGEVYGYLTGLFCALGHAFPCYYKFKGGKCVAVTAAVALVMEPIVFLFLLIIFVATVALTKYVSLGSVLAAMTFPVLLHNIMKMKYGSGNTGIIFVIINCLLVIYLHRGNLKRLVEGKENKFQFKKGKKEDKTEEK